MSVGSAPTPPPIGAVVYPDGDGEPMADNTVQYAWIATLKWNAEAQFRNDPDVFVAGDHWIYAEEGSPAVRQAPDVYVALGRPKRDRGSYKVWEEGGVFPQVVIEVWSPNNRYTRMQEKFAFYDRHGAEEYYILYPDFPAYVEAWRRDGGRLAPLPVGSSCFSPRLGWTFGVVDGYPVVFGRNGRPLQRPDEVLAERDAEKARADRYAAKLRALGLDPDAG